MARKFYAKKNYRNRARTAFRRAPRVYPRPVYTKYTKKNNKIFLEFSEERVISQYQLRAGPVNICSHIPYIGNNAVTNSTAVPDIGPIQNDMVYNKLTNQLSALIFFETVYISKVVVTLSLPQSAIFAVKLSRVSVLNVNNLGGILEGTRTNTFQYTDKIIENRIVIAPGEKKSITMSAKYSDDLLWHYDALDVNVAGRIRALSILC